MTLDQHYFVKSWLSNYDAESTTVHLGDCIGADAEAWEIADSLRFWLYGHPPVNNLKRAWCKYHFIAEPKPYLDRNKDIVDASDFLLATPGEPQEQLRSGTWSTVRYARRRGVDGLLILPDGDVTDLNGKRIG